MKMRKSNGNVTILNGSHQRVWKVVFLVGQQYYSVRDNGKLEMVTPVSPRHTMVAHLCECENSWKTIAFFWWRCLEAL